MFAVLVSQAIKVILSWKQYTKAIDVWSVGCIFAELLGRKPLFQGKDYIHQITRTGMPLALRTCGPY